MNAYMLTKMTWEEVQEALNTVKLAIVPIGAHEQHGPHMVESCDAVLATNFAEKLAERLHPDVLVTPTMNMGASHHHLNFPGTISLEPETIIAIMRDIIRSLKRHGLDKFLFLNSHGGNQSILAVAATKLAEELDVDVYFAKSTASAKDAMKEHVHSPLFGHSCEREVSEALYLAPELVRKDLLDKGDIQKGVGRWEKLRPGHPVQGFYRYEEMTANGCLGDGTQASEAIGRQIVEEALEKLTKAIKELI